MAVSNSVNLLHNSICHKFKIIENAEDNQDVIYLKPLPKWTSNYECHPRQTICYSVPNPMFRAFPPRSRLLDHSYSLLVLLPKVHISPKALWIKVNTVQSSLELSTLGGLLWIFLYVTFMIIHPYTEYAIFTSLNYVGLLSVCHSPCPSPCQLFPSSLLCNQEFLLKHITSFLSLLSCTVFISTH